MSMISWFFMIQLSKIKFPWSVNEESPWSNDLATRNFMIQWSCDSKSYDPMVRMCKNRFQIEYAVYGIFQFYFNQVPQIITPLVYLREIWNKTPSENPVIFLWSQDPSMILQILVKIIQWSYDRGNGISDDPMIWGRAEILIPWSPFKVSRDPWSENPWSYEYDPNE